MTNYICATCAAQFADSDQPPAHCPICEDERQYVGMDGQKWATPQEIAADHHIEIEQEEPYVYGISLKPTFAIGQRAMLIQTSQGNILWEATPIVDEAAIKAINDLGGVQHICGSHPHLWGSMVDWSRAFGNPPIHIPESSKQWVMRPDNMIRYWASDAHTICDGITMVRCGGHFEGSCVLHMRDGAGGRGAIFTGDTIMVASDRRYVSFMYSYPNYIPLSAKVVRSVAKAVEPYAFDRIYGAWKERVIQSDAKAAIARSVERYIKAIEG